MTEEREPYSTLPGAPLPLQKSGWDDEFIQLVCPVCGDLYVHTRRVTDEQGVEDYRNGWVRGGVTRLDFYCESSHTFAIEFGFHKGYTFIRVAPDHGQMRWDNEDVP